MSAREDGLEAVGAVDGASVPSSRFRLLRRIGAGGMGVVYEAEDKRSRARVALKTLKVADAASIYRFKNEFRSLADVVHPNLVALHDLFADASGLFFTMELIEGVDFLRYVTGGDLTTPQTRVDPLAETTHDTDREPSAVVVATGREAAPTTAPDVPVAAPTTRPRCDYDRLRLSLRQLAAGIIALHSAGKLHRDIKPSNVMVTTEGRVVLLDFGLVRSLYPGGDRATAEHQISGTAEYMSPEQAASLELSGASDWYSVGVMMFQSLTGSVPFRGSTLRVLMDKQHADARRPSTLVPEIPTDLDTLCWALLRRRPEERPSGDSILEQLGDELLVTHAALDDRAADVPVRRAGGADGHARVVLRRALRRANADGLRARIFGDGQERARASLSRRAPVLQGGRGPSGQVLRARVRSVQGRRQSGGRAQQPPPAPPRG